MITTSVAWSRSSASLASSADADAPTIRKRPDAVRRFSSPREVVVWSRSTTYAGVSRMVNVAALDSTRSWTTGTMMTCTSVALSRTT